MSTKTKGFTLAALAGGLWGLSGAIGQYLFDEKGVVAIWLVCYRLLFSGIILLIFLLCRKMDVVSIWMNKQHRRRLLLHSIAGMMMVQFTFFKAIETSNAGTATVLQYLNPAMLLVFFTMVKKKKPSKKEILVVAMALFGIFMVATGGNVESLTLSVEGLMWGLACAFFSCVYSVLPIELLKVYDAKVICGFGMFIGGVVLCLISKPWDMGIIVDSGVVLIMIFIIIFGTIIPFSCALMSLPMIGPVNTNLLASVEPIVAAIVAFAFLGTVFSIGEVVGFIFIIGTILILALSKE